MDASIKKVYLHFLFVIVLLIQSCSGKDVVKTKQDNVILYNAVQESYDIDSPLAKAGVFVGGGARNVQKKYQQIRFEEQSSTEFIVYMNVEEYKVVKKSKDDNVFGITGKNVTFGSGVFLGDSIVLLHIEKIVGEQLSYINIEGQREK